MLPLAIAASSPAVEPPLAVSPLAVSPGLIVALPSGSPMCTAPASLMSAAPVRPTLT
jgi:hypothetical protein